MHDLQVGFFVPPADVIRFPDYAIGEDPPDRNAMVFYVEPVTDLPARDRRLIPAPSPRRGSPARCQLLVVTVTVTVTVTAG